MLSEREKRDILEGNNVIVKGHFVLQSGLHAGQYFNKAELYKDTVALATLCQEIAQMFEGEEPGVVVGPAIGGILLSQWVAHHLRFLTGKKVLSLFAEKSTKTDQGVATNPFVFGRGFEKYIQGSKCLVVEDTLSTGDSVSHICRLIWSLGGKTCGIGALNRSRDVSFVNLFTDLPVYSVFNIRVPMWPFSECPLCQSKQYINTDLGHGEEFIAKQSKTEVLQLALKSIHV